MVPASRPSAYTAYISSLPAAYARVRHNTHLRCTLASRCDRCEQCQRAPSRTGHFRAVRMGSRLSSVLWPLSHDSHSRARNNLRFSDRSVTVAGAGQAADTHWCIPQCSYRVQLHGLYGGRGYHARAVRGRLVAVQWAHCACPSCALFVAATDIGRFPGWLIMVGHFR